MWVSMVSDDSLDSFGHLQPSEIIETVCRKEIRETLKSFHRDCCKCIYEVINSRSNLYSFPRIGTLCQLVYLEV